MPYFKDAEEFYDIVGGLWREMLDDPELVERFKKANTTVLYRCEAPTSQITVRTVEGEEPQLHFGDSELEPEVTMSMDADVAHRFWLGKVNVTVALARGHMHARGPVAKILRLVPLVKPMFPRYRERLERAGREDLAAVE